MNAQEKSQKMIFSRENSTQQYDNTSRYKLTPKEDNYQLILDKHQNNNNINPLTEHVAASESLILEQQHHHKCPFCDEMAKKVSQISMQLRVQKKKNIKCRQALDKNLQKQRELFVNYVKIAKNVKKQINENTPCLCKNKITSQNYLQTQQLIIDYKDKIITIQRQLQEEINKVEQWRNKCQQLQQKLGSVVDLSQSNSPEKVMNDFYQQQIQKLHQQINALESRLNVDKFDCYQHGQNQIRCSQKNDKIASLANQIRQSSISIGSQADKSFQDAIRFEIQANSNPQIKITEMLQKAQKQLKNVQTEKQPMQQNPSQKQQTKPLNNSRPLSQKAPSFQQQKQMEQAFQSINNSKISSIEAKPDRNSSFEQRDIFNSNELFKKRHSSKQSSSFQSLGQLSENYENYQSILSKVGKSMHSVVNQQESKYHSILSEQILNQSQYQKGIIQQQKGIIQQKDILEAISFYSIQSQLSVSYLEEGSNVANQGAFNTSFRLRQQNLAHQPLQNGRLQAYSQVVLFQNKDQENLKGTRNQKNEIAVHTNSQRQKIIYFANRIEFFLKKMGLNLNRIGQKYKANFQMLEIPHISLTTNKVQLLNIIEKSTFSREHLETIIEGLSDQIQKIMVCCRRQSQKAIYDRDLVISDNINKLNAVYEENQSLKNIISNFRLYNSKLQYRLSYRDDERSNVDMLEQTHKNQHFKEAIRKRISILAYLNSSEQQVQCQLLAPNIENLKNQMQSAKNRAFEAILYIPKCLNMILDKKSKSRISQQIATEKDLNQQIYNVIQTAFNNFEKVDQKQHNYNIFRRKSIGNIELNKLKAERIQLNSLSNQKIQSKQIINVEYNQLKTELLQKSNKIRQMSKKLALERQQKCHNKQLIQSLQQQIKAMGLQLQMEKQKKKQKIEENFEKTGVNDISQEAEFLEYSSKKQFNNLHWERDEEVKQLKEKLELCEKSIRKYEVEEKKRRRKIIYIGN